MRDGSEERERDGSEKRDEKESKCQRVDGGSQSEILEIVVIPFKTGIRSSS